MLALLLFAAAVAALSPAAWRQQSIYFLLTDRFARTDNSTTASCDTSQRAYCGGTWQGVINQLEYIQGMGFTAVWITPVTGQFYESTGDGTSYHGYWQQDAYALNPHLGTAADLAALSAALHARGMYLMVDVVANHMGYDGTAVDYGVFRPFDAQSYFHAYCLISDYSDQANVEDCWLGDTTVTLPDLDTTQPAVQALWYSWVAGLVGNYSIDGLRIDTVKHVQKDFWPGYNAAAGVYCVGEVYDGDPAYACAYQDVLDGVLNYPVYYPLRAAFASTGGSLAALASTVAAVAAACADPTLLGSFVENHDNPRFASYTSDLALAQNALAFLFFADGIPIVYAGQEQHYSGGSDPANREAVWLSGYATTSTLYQHVRASNQIRRLLLAQDPAWAAAPNDVFYQSGSVLAMRKGSAAGSQALTVLTNAGASTTTTTLALAGSGYAAGAALVELYSCTPLAVDSSGSVPVPMASGLPRVLVPAAWVGGSGLCGASTATASTTTTTASTTTTTTCPSTVAVTFAETVTTSYGENVFLVGSLAALGSWDPGSAVALSAAAYTAAAPLWTATVALPAGTAFAYKFVKKEADGSVVWESDPNRAYTVPTCAASATVASSWQ